MEMKPGERTGVRQPHQTVSLSMTIAVALALASIALASVDATMAPRVEAQFDHTCVYTKSGRPLGCLPSAYYCGNLYGFRQGSRLFLREEDAPKELNQPRADTAGERVRPGLWRIVTWPGRRLLGRAVETNRSKAYWRITNARAALVGTARGPEGPQIAMVLLSRGANYFC
jgi:hypothetical protein